MNSQRKQLLTSLGCFLTVVILGYAMLVWPARKQARAIRTETASLLEDVSNLTGTAEHVQQLRAELQYIHARVDNELKVIPDAPPVDIMSRLSLHVDGDTVRDWSLTQGMPQSASTDERVSAQVVPWTAEIKARFNAVFDVLQKAESMNELVRVSSVRLSRSGGARQRSNTSYSTNELDDEPIVTAAIVFEAVYDPGKEQR